jgi:sortase (surface protein transpeptidase)
MKLIDRINNSGRRGTATMGGAVLALIGAAIISIAVLGQQVVASPSASAAKPLLSPSPNAAKPAKPPSSPAATPTVHGPIMDASIPTSVSIPSIDVHSSLIKVGLTANGSLQVPQPGPNYNKAAWYTGSPTPGERGPSIIEGHVDSAAEGPSVFFRLGDLRPGDQVNIAREDESTAVFTVTSVIQVPKEHFPTDEVYRDTDHAALRLISCGGTFDHATGHYRSNIIAFGKLTGVQR